MKFNQIAVATLIAATPMLSQAKIVWQDFSVTGLYGENYEVGTDIRKTVTLEYAAKYSYADVFMFMDRQWQTNHTNSTYSEVAPRLSLGEITGKNLSVGPVKDVLIATTWEANREHNNNFDNFLYGVGFSFDVPYTQYVNLNLYRAHNDKISDDYQMTLTYGIPFSIKNEDFLVDAFLDWSTAENDHASELNWTSQYKWNVGKHISPNTRLYVGVEHSIWNNKFGIKGVDQHDVSALIKYHF